MEWAVNEIIGRVHADLIACFREVPVLKVSDDSRRPAHHLVISSLAPPARQRRQADRAATPATILPTSVIDRLRHKAALLLRNRSLIPASRPRAHCNPDHPP